MQQDIEKLKSWLKKSEGFKAFPYEDTTGHWTVGYGHNLTDKGISPQIAELILEEDIKECINSLKYFDWFLKQPETVQQALIRMCFNLGINGLLKFKKMIHYLDQRDYVHAAIECLDSLWARQVGQRAKDIAVVIREAKT